MASSQRGQTVGVGGEDIEVEQGLGGPVREGASYLGETRSLPEHMRARKSLRLGVEADNYVAPRVISTPALRATCFEDGVWTLRLRTEALASSLAGHAQFGGEVGK